MAKLFITNNTKFVIENAPPKVSWPRPYLGMSGIAGDCLRKLWLGFHWAAMSEVSTRAYRIFERGDIEEARIIRDLKAVGIEIFRREGDKKIEMTGEIGEKQEELVSCFGHAKGHPDGRMLGVIESPKTEHLLEMKTMAEKYFKAFVESGVKISHPVYYGQMTRYMGKMNLTRAMLIATNKNNEERHYERIKYDKDYDEILQAREELIVMSEEPVGEKYSKNHFKCTYCNNKKVCHEGAAPLVTCRSCEFVDLGENGTWICCCPYKKEKVLTIDEQKAACKFYKRLF